MLSKSVTIHKDFNVTETIVSKIVLSQSLYETNFLQTAICKHTFFHHSLKAVDIYFVKTKVNI